MAMIRLVRRKGSSLPPLRESAPADAHNQYRQQRSQRQKQPCRAMSCKEPPEKQPDNGDIRASLCAKGLPEARRRVRRKSLQQRQEQKKGQPGPSRASLSATRTLPDSVGGQASGSVARMKTKVSPSSSNRTKNCGSLTQNTAVMNTGKKQTIAQLFAIARPQTRAARSSHDCLCLRRYSNRHRTM